MFEDCYFWVDDSVAEEDRNMSVLCLKCRDEKMPDVGWLWKGSFFGYGPFDFICSLCGHVVYSPNHNEKEDKKENETEPN
jgi:hypothetical protein